MNRFVLVLLAAMPVFGEDAWTRFRGPNGTGVSTESGFPVRFDRETNLVWRTPVRAGKSSPVVTAKHVFLTTHSGEELFTECYDRATGRQLWARAVPRVHHDLANKLNSPAGITPVTDGDRVYSFFKDFGMAAYDAAGKELWRAPLGPFVTSMGLGASPILAGNNVVVVADQLEGSFIAAFDRANGELRWKTARDEAEGWGTPLFYESGGVPYVLTASRGVFGAHRSADGKRAVTWRGLSSAIVSSPAFDGENMFSFGYGSDAPAPFSRTLARYDKNGDGKLQPEEYGDDPFVHGIARHSGNRDLVVTEDEWDAKQREVGGPTFLVAFHLEADGEAKAPFRARELWKVDRGFNHVIPSPLAYHGTLYVVKNGGILTAYDAATGKVIKAGRVDGAIGGFSASPVAAEGRVYLANEDGKIAVLEGGGEWRVTQVNDLDEGIYATPALAGGAIYIRTTEALYRFETK
ncbi:MAG: PQQ-binding-like beta-propeller repeat protein [Bryobacteraceae bacterium]